MEASICMKVCRTMFWSLVGILLITRSILGYSTGAQTDSCSSLTVDHVDGNGNPISASNSPSPFTVQVLSGDSVYRENRAVKVVINVPAGTQFTGFVLQARDTETSRPVGQWDSLLTDGTRTISCFSEDDTITHSSNIAVTSTLELQWTPSQDYGQVEFLASIAQDFNVFWNNVRSQPLSFDSRPVFYVDQNEITLTEGGITMYVGLCVNRPIPRVPVALTFIEDTATTNDIVPVSMNLDLPLASNLLCLPYGLIPVDDAEGENPEVLLLAISSVGENGVIDDMAATVTITILDNDEKNVEIGVSENPLRIEVSEADGEALIEVCASITLDVAVSVGFTVARLADPTVAVTQDLTFASPVIIPAGQSCTSVRINIVQDNLVEDVEVFLVTLRSSDPIGEIVRSTVVLSLLDSAEVGISITSEPLTIPENSGPTQIQVCASRRVNVDLNIAFDIISLLSNDPASDDITFTSPLTILSGTMCNSININIVSDNLVEETETFRLTLMSVEPIGVLRQSSVVLTLLDSQEIGISITSETLVLSEDSGSTQIQVCASRVVDADVTIAFDIVSFSNAPASDDITFTSPVTIISGTMCSSISINIVPDNLVEETETFLLTLVSAEPIGVLTQSSAVVMLMDSQGPTVSSTISITTREISVREDAGRTSFQICATPPSPNDVTIGIQTETVSSLAGGITVGNSVTIPSGMACVQHEVVIQDDDIPESGERYTVIITFVPLPYTIGNVSQLAIAVQDNDEDIEIFLPVSISPSSLSVTEGDNGTLNICYLGVQTTTSVSLSTTLETAEGQDLAADFPVGDFTVQVDDSQECISLQVIAIDDDVFEGDETLLVTILSVSTVSSMRLDERQTTATVTILEKGPQCIIEMPCQNDGQCIDEEGGGVSCNCGTGWIGPTCEISDPCQPTNPCQNSGVCSTSLSGDAVDVVCMCTDAWTGANCENAVVCLADPCQNGATCEPVQDGSDYQCINCSPMYEGKNCDIFLPCSSSPCRNGGTCTNLGQMDFECACLSEFAGKDCTFENPCLSNPCDNGDCAARDDGFFECNCFSGFFGSTCETTESCLTGPCQNGGSCIPFGDNPSDFACECRRGFRGLRCHLVDFCANGPCLNGGDCTNQVDGFTCECRSGFEGTNCNIELIPFYPGQCFSRPCANGGTCTERSNSFSCNCPRGWTGETCRTRQTCTSDENPPCQNNGTCWQTLTGVTCACPSGFTGSVCESGNQGDDSCEPNPCKNGGSCFPLQDGKFVCTCLPGLFSGVQCQNCPCKNGGTCSNNRCECPTNTMGEFCEILEPCIGMNCNNGGMCVVVNNMPSCDCRDGFVGDTCNDRDLCLGVTCFNGGTCQQNDAGKCLCRSGFGGDNCQIQSQSSQSGSQNASPGLQGFILCLLMFSSIVLLFT